MKNTLLMVVVIVFILIGLAIASGAGGGVIDAITKKDVEITYESTKTAGTSFTAGEMSSFDGLDYKIIGNKIILNKNGIYAGKELTIMSEQTCLEWGQDNCIEYTTADCTAWSTPECIGWEERPAPICLKENEEKVCTEWEAPKGCKEFDYKVGECLAWESEAKCNQYSESYCTAFGENACKVYAPAQCTKTTAYTRDDFIKITIQQEIEQRKRDLLANANRTETKPSIEGKVIITSKTVEK